PTPANYIQRAGRAGRRRDGAAFAVSFARSTPHDQFHFHSPLEIVRGKVPVPQINLANSRLTQRHINSFLLGQYLLVNAVVETGERIEVGHFFFDPTSDNSHANRYPKFLVFAGAKLLPSIKRIIPAECELLAEEAINNSANQLVGTGGVASRLE